MPRTNLGNQSSKRSHSIGQVDAHRTARTKMNDRSSSSSVSISSEYDLFSKDLDPELVLFQASEASIIHLDRNQRPLDSLYKARYLLPEGDPDRLVARRRPSSDEEDEEDDQPQESADAPVKVKSKPPQNELPFESMAARFAEGPMSLLKNSLNQVIRVKVRRKGGVQSWCAGRLAGFDRHFNLLLLNAVEKYSVKEEIFVSARRKTLKDKVALFLSDFDSLAEPAQRAEMLLVEHGSNEAGLWKDLHEKYGVRAKVEALEKIRNVDALLKRWTGNEYQLLKHLEAKAKAEPPPSAALIAEWVRLPSMKYPGNFFYQNNRTMESVWEAPKGVTFRRVFTWVPREKHFRQMIVRGDCIVLISRPTGSATEATA